jgi:hypothetical protein
MTDRDHWIETLRCPRCLRVAPAKLSTADGLSWKVRADDIPEGFKFIDGNFFAVLANALWNHRTPCRKTMHRFRKQAEECRQQAAKATSPLDEETLLRVAEDWIRLAQSTEERRG